MSKRLHFDSAWAERFAAAGWDSFEKIRKLDGSQLARGDRSGVRIVTPPAETGIPPFVLKRYRYPFVHMLRTWLTTPKARREFQNLSKAREAGMQAPQPLAYGYRKILGFEKESFLLTAQIPQAQSLREWREEIVRGRQSLPPFQRLRSMLEDFGSRLGQFHRAGQFHHTLYFKNILWSQANGKDRLFVIDNPWGNRWLGRVFVRAARVRDLACLEKGAKQALPKTARLRFLKIYLQKERLDEECRELARRVRALVLELENDTPLSRFADDFKHYFHGKLYYRTALQARESLALLPIAILPAIDDGEIVDSPVEWGGVLALVTAGLLLRTQALREIPMGSSRFVRLFERAEGGIFQRMRQPVYLGNILLLAGICSIFEFEWPLLAAALWIFVVYWASNRYEERILSRRFGPRFQVYRERVPLFFPRLWGRAAP